VVSRLDPRGCQSLDGVVPQEATVPRLEAEHLAGRIVEGPGEAGGVVGTGLGTLLPLRDRGRIGNIRVSVVCEDDLVLRGAPEVCRVAGWVIQLVLATTELGVVGLHSAARLVFRLFQSKLNFDVDQVSVDVANNHEHCDGFVESFVLGPGNGTLDRVAIGQYLGARIRNTDVAARFLGCRSNLNSGLLPDEGHFDSLRDSSQSEEEER